MPSDAVNEWLKRHPVTSVPDVPAHVADVPHPADERVVTRQDQPAPKPTRDPGLRCAHCDGELPRHPEWDLVKGERRYFCVWKCFVVRRAREGQARERGIATRMGWL